MASNLHETLIFKSAIFSRILLLLLTLIWRTLLSPYDTSAPLNPDCLITTNPESDLSRKPFLLTRLASALENGVVWDSVYFVRIAQCGYEYEQTYAFLPLLPICIALLSRTLFAPLVPLIGERAVMALSGYVITNVAFVLAAICFYRLSVVVLKDSEAAVRASVLFCYNPASIFYSSIYSESLYALLSIGGLYMLMSGGNNFAALLFALSGCARSNGVLNAGYLCFQTMHQAYDATFHKKDAISALKVVISGTFRCGLVFSPFISFQAYGYHNICLGHSPDDLRPWCKARIPLLYNYIQGRYWGVGFLRYFQFKQLPNFLLASPILSLAFCSIIHYARTRPNIIFSLGFQAFTEEKHSGAVFFCSSDDLQSDTASDVEKTPSKARGLGSKPTGGDCGSSEAEDHNLRQRKKTTEGDVAVLPSKLEPASIHGYLSASVLPFLVHMGFMAATAFFVMHVQVATRFLSASPPLYWFTSYLIASGCYRRWGYVIWSYCAAYILLGSLLFSNFLPFT